MRRVISRLLAVFLVFGLLASPAAAFAQTTPPEDEPTGVVASGKTSKYLSVEPMFAENVGGFETTDRFIVLLETPSLVAYDGSIAGLQRAPVDDSGTVKFNSPAAQTYLRYVNNEIDSVIAQTSNSLGRDISRDVAFRYDTILGGFAAKMSEAEARKVAALPQVKAVYPDYLDVPHTDTSPTWLGTTGIWDGTNTSGVAGQGLSTKGEGTIVGILDTGINTDHPSFAAVGPVDGYVHVNPYGPGVYKGLCATDPDKFKCNDKLIGVYAFTPDEPLKGEDTEDHGSHTASTAAGNTIDAPYGGSTVRISGMAPHANIIAYDVCDAKSEGCPNASSLAAAQQALLDGVDVINYSIGPTSGPGRNPYSDAVELAFLELVKAGAVVATSAGNSGPNEKTTYKGSPWDFTVANTNHGRIFGHSVVFKPAGASSDPTTLVSAVGIPGTGVPMTTDLTGIGVVAASNLGCAATDYPVATGKAVLVSRGDCTFAEKIDFAKNAGAAVAIVYNNSGASPIVMSSDDVTIPAMMISQAGAQAMIAALTAESTLDVTVAQVSQTDPNWADVLNQSSSRGPFTVIDTLEPEVAAPGTNVLAAYGSYNPDGTPKNGAAVEVDLMSGTSMASPHVAGNSALMRALHPTWTAMEIKSAMMMTALPGTTKDYDMSTNIDNFDYGTGRLDMTKADLTGLVMDETYDNFVNANPTKGGDVKKLNIPSYQNSVCLGSCSFTRTFKSVADVPATYTATVDSTTTAGVVITVNPASFTVQPGATQTVTFNVDVSAAAMGKFSFGRVNFTTTDSFLSGKAISNVAIPLAVQPAVSNIPGYVRFEVGRDQGASYLRDMRSADITGFTTTIQGMAQGTVTDIELLPDPTGDDPFDDLSQVYWKTFRMPAEPSRRYVLEILETTAADVDIFFGRGTVPTAATLQQYSATETAYEYLNRITGLTVNRDFWILIQNWDGTATGDSIRFAEGLVPFTDNGNLVIKPATTPVSGQPYDLEFDWNLPSDSTPTPWYGYATLFKDPAGGTVNRIGVMSIDIARSYNEVEKTISTDHAEQGDKVKYTITINPNQDDFDKTYTISDALPNGIEYMMRTLKTTGSDTPATYDAATRTINWSGMMPAGYMTYLASTNATDPTCRMPMGDGKFVDLAGFGIGADPSLTGDTQIWNYTGVGAGMSWYGAPTSETPAFTDDGHAYLNGFDNSRYWYWENSNFPDPAAPNDVMAAWMQDLVLSDDIANGKGVRAAGLGGANPVAWIVQFDGSYPFDQDPATFSMDYQYFMWKEADPRPGSADLLFAFRNVVGPWAQPGTTGVENGTGTIGTSVDYGNFVPTSGMVVCLDYAPAPIPPVTIEFEAFVTAAIDNYAVVNAAMHDHDGANTVPEAAEATLLISPYPVAVEDRVITAEDTPIDITVEGKYLEPGPVTWTLVTQPTNGVLTGELPNMHYAPNANFNGEDFFEFKVSDGITESNVAKLTISVLPVNDLPVAEDQAVTTNEDTELSITLVGTDVENDTLTYTIVDSPTAGTASLVDNVVTYMPNANYHGEDKFTFKVNDGKGDSNVATVTITVNSVNDKPVAEGQDVTTNEDTAIVIDLVASDVDGDALTYIVVDAPLNGAVKVEGAKATYTPNANYNGPDSFTFKVNDGTEDSETALVSITVIAVDDTPVAEDQAVTTDEDTPVEVTLVATDVETEELTYSLVGLPANGKAVLVGNVVTYTPNLNFNGTDTFTFKASDGALESLAATVTVTVRPVNDQPLAEGQAVTTVEDTPVVISLKASDVDKDTLTYLIVKQPANGKLALNGSRVTYTPNANFNGDDSFTFKVNDGKLDSAVATVSIKVTAVHDGPQANDDAYTVEMNNPLMVLEPGVLANDKLVDKGDLYCINVRPENAPKSGKLSKMPNGPLGVRSDGGFVYMPNTGFAGVDSFVYDLWSVPASIGCAPDPAVIQASGVYMDSATVTIEVRDPNPAPVIPNRLFMPIIGK